MSLAVLLFLAAVVTARPQSDSLERRFPVPELGEVAVGEKPMPLHQLRPQELDKPSIVPESVPAPSGLFFGQAITFEQPSKVSSDPTPDVQEVSGPNSDTRFKFGDVPSSEAVEFRPEVQPAQKNPRQGAGLNGQSLHHLRDRDAHVVRHDRLEPSADGFAGVSYETSNGINVVSRTSLDKDGFNVVEGSYSYVSVDGLPVHVRYIADRNGFRYTGLGLPVGPEIPLHAQEQIERGKRLHEEAARRRAERQRL